MASVIMKCQKCVDKGLRSKVYVGMSTTTLMAPSPPFYDEDGNFHYGKNPNITTTQYKCSNGHRWAESVGPTERDRL